MNNVHEFVFGLLVAFGWFAFFAIYAYWQSLRGKTLQEIWVGNDPARTKRFVSLSRSVLLSGVVLVGLFVAWVHWKYP